MKTKIHLLGGLIIVPVFITGNNKKVYEFTFALDTGSNRTIINPFVTKQIGNIPTQSNMTITTGSKESEKVKETIIKKFDLYDFTINQYNCIVKQLPVSINFIDGLLGLDFFLDLRLKLFIDFDKKTISID
jgi:DUF438 domain-containing protein